jgi:hypothetical protein
LAETRPFPPFPPCLLEAAWAPPFPPSMLKASDVTVLSSESVRTSSNWSNWPREASGVKATEPELSTPALDNC